MFDSKVASARSEFCYARRERRYSTKGGAATAARRAYNRAVRRSERALVVHERTLHFSDVCQDVREQIYEIRHTAWTERLAEAQADLEEIRERHLAAYHELVSAHDSGAPRSHRIRLGERLEALSEDFAMQAREVEWLDMNEPQL